MRYIPYRRPLFPLHEAPQVSAEALSRDFGRSLKGENATREPRSPSDAICSAAGGASEALPGRAEERLIVTDGGSCHAPAKPTLAYKKKFC